MRKIFRSVIPPLLSLVIVMLGNGFFTTFTSLRFAIDGYPNFVIGVLGGAYYLGMMLGALYVERVIRRIGHIRSFAVMASINSVIIILKSFYIDPYLWTIYRILIGFCTSGFFISIESWLLLSSGLKSRGKLLSFYMLTIYLAQGFGQFLLNVAPIQSLLPFAVTVILSSLSIIPVAMMRSSGSPLLESTLTNVFQVVRRSPLGPIGCFISGLIMSSFYGLAPIFGKQIQLSLFQISQIMGFTIMGGLLLQWPIGHLSDIFNRRKVIIGVTLALMCITLALYHSNGFPYYLLLALMVLFGGISFTLYPLSITYTCDHFSEKKVISITCLLLLIYGIGCVIGPLISPLFMSYFGPAGLFLYVTILCAIFLLICMCRLFYSKPVSEEEQSDYIPLPRATSIALYLDPKSDGTEEEEIDEMEEDFHPFNEEYEEEE